MSAGYNRALIYSSLLFVSIITFNVNALSIHSKYPLDNSQLKSRGLYSISLDILNILTNKETTDVRLIWNSLNTGVRAEVMQKIVNYHLPDSAAIAMSQLNPSDHGIGYISFQLNLFKDYDSALNSLATSTTPWILHVPTDNVMDGPVSNSWHTILKLFDIAQPHLQVTNISKLYQLDLFHKLAVIYKYIDPSLLSHINIDSVTAEIGISDRNYNRDYVFLDLSPTSCLWRNHKHRKLLNGNNQTIINNEQSPSSDVPKNTLKLDGYYITKNEFRFISHGNYDAHTDEWVVNDKYISNGKPRRQKSATEWYRSLCADAMFYRVSTKYNTDRICTRVNESNIVLYKTAHDKILSTPDNGDDESIITNPNYKKSRLRTKIEFNKKIILCLDYSIDKSIVPTSFLYDNATLDAVEGLGILFEDTAPGRPFVMIRENLIDKNDEEIDDDMDDGDGESNENVIIWGRREIDRYIDYLNYDARNDRYIFIFCGESTTITSSITSDMLIDPSMIPELDWWRGLFIVIVLTFLIRRSLSRNTELQLAVAECSIEHNTLYNKNEWELVASAHLTILAIDPFIYGLFLISGIWYIVALSTFLPPVPTYVAYWLWVVLSISAFTFGLALLVAHFLYTYKYVGWTSCLADSMSHTVFGATLCDCTKTDTALTRKVSLAYIMILRAMGYIVGISTILFSLWWDTDDSFGWGLISITLFIASIYLTYHSIEMWMLVSLFFRSRTFAISSMLTILYSIIIITISGLVTGYGFVQVILPFLQSVNVVYSNDVVVFGMWIMYVFFIGICISMIHSDIVEMKTILHNYKHQQKHRKS